MADVVAPTVVDEVADQAGSTSTTDPSQSTSVEIPPLFEYLKAKKTTNELEAAVKANPDLLKDLNTKTHRKGTPLLYCLVSRAFTKVELLLRYGADPSLSDTLTKYGYDTPIPPIFIAVGAGSMAAAEVLLRAGADLRATHLVELDDQGDFTLDLLSSTFLRSYKAGDPIAMLSWVIKKGKELGIQWNVNFVVPGTLKKTMLGICVAAKLWASAYLLLENGADPNLADEEGWTPLHTTCMADNPNISLLLMMYGANDSIRTEDDQAWMPAEKADAATKNMVKNGALYQRVLSRSKQNSVK